MTDVYDYVTLMCRLKAAQTRNKELESGERYVRLKEQILEDMLVEFEQAQKKAEQELRIMEMRALKAEKQRDEEMTL